jgi:hypothetical protein
MYLHGTILIYEKILACNFSFVILDHTFHIFITTFASAFCMPEWIEIFHLLGNAHQTHSLGIWNLFLWTPYVWHLILFWEPYSSSDILCKNLVESYSLSVTIFVCSLQFSKHLVPSSTSNLPVSFMY